jgi:flagellar protein FliO/FliZ
MAVKIALCLFLLLWLPASHAVIPDTAASNQAVRGVTSGDVMAWGLGLVIVLIVFFLCVWGIRKLGGLNVGGSTEQIRMIGGLSLGMREKVVLLQVGKQQLVLGVTPSRIEALMVLEGDNCLQRGEAPIGNAGSGFSQKLAQTLKASTDA